MDTCWECFRSIAFLLTYLCIEIDWPRGLFLKEREMEAAASEDDDDDIPLYFVWKGRFALLEYTYSFLWLDSCLAGCEEGWWPGGARRRQYWWRVTLWDPSVGSGPNPAGSVRLCSLEVVLKNKTVARPYGTRDNKQTNKHIHSIFCQK
jgi:hypothetical protein